MAHPKSDREVIDELIKKGALDDFTSPRTTLSQVIQQPGRTQIAWTEKTLAEWNQFLLDRVEDNLVFGRSEAQYHVGNKFTPLIATAFFFKRIFYVYPRRIICRILSHLFPSRTTRQK